MCALGVPRGSVSCHSKESGAPRCVFPGWANPSSWNQSGALVKRLLVDWFKIRFRVLPLCDFLLNVPCGVGREVTSLGKAFIVQHGFFLHALVAGVSFVQFTILCVLSCPAIVLLRVSVWCLFDRWCFRLPSCPVSRELRD